MRLHKRIIVSAVALALASQFSALSAKSPVDQQLINDAMPMVDKAPEGFFVTAPYINTLITMNVRVFDNEGAEVLNVRSLGEMVGLFAADLPDGEYSYETVSVFQLDEAVGEGPHRTDEAMSKESGRFTIKNRSVLQPESNLDELSREQDEFSLMDTVLDTAIATLAYAVSPFVSSASAQNLTAISTAPAVNWEDLDSTSFQEFNVTVQGVADDSSGTWILNDVVGFASPITPVISISTVENSAIGNSMNIASNGDISWAESGIFFDKSTQELSLGSTSTPAQLNIFDLTPSINMEDETDGSQLWMQADAGTAQFWGYTVPNGYRLVMNYDFEAPDYSLSIDDTGFVGMGTNFPEENLHVVGNVLTNDYFRGQSVNPGFWIDETGSGNKGANVVLDGGVLQIQRRGQGFGAFESSIFRLNVNAPAQSFTLNAVGYLGLGVQNANFPIQSSTGARLSAGGVWQNASSRALKENILVVDAEQALAAFKELKPVTYNYKVDSEDTYIGFIAEDVPEIVASKDRKTLSSMDMVALLTRVVQDQQGTIEEETVKMEAMEQQLENQQKLFVQQQERMEKLEAMIRLISGLENSDSDVAANLK